jgi:hypothetical protein
MNSLSLIMARFGKFVFSFLLVLSIVISTTELTVNAQSTSTKPSVPKFSILFPDNSTIQLIVENQAFTNSSSVNALVYYVRVKDHYSNQSGLIGNYYLQSSSETTNIRQSTNLFLNGSPFSNITLLDFQVQAQTGYYAVSNKSGPPHLISPSPQQWHTEITFNESETSDWSDPVSVDLSKMTVVTPSVPEFPITISLVTILVAVGLLLVFGKRKLSIINH